MRDTPDNDYEVQVTVADSDGLTDVQDITVTVTNIPQPPAITNAADVDAAENQTAVTDVDAIDPEGETEGAGLSYSLTGGTDQGAFGIDANSGVLTFDAPPDFENPTDANTNNIYRVPGHGNRLGWLERLAALFGDRHRCQRSAGNHQRRWRGHRVHRCC